MKPYQNCNVDFPLKMCLQAQDETTLMTSPGLFSETWWKGMMRHRHYFHNRTHHRLSLNNFLALNQPDQQLLGPLVWFGQTAGRSLDRWRTSEQYEVSLQRTTSPASVPNLLAVSFPGLTLSLALMLTCFSAVKPVINGPAVCGRMVMLLYF